MLYYMVANFLKRRCLILMSFFGNLMNNYYYGKAGKGDYRIQDMPQNRFQLFGEVFKVRWSGIFGVNLLYMVFWLPTFIWSLIHFSMLFSGEEIIAGNTIQSYFTIYLIGLVPCVAITGPFTAGATYVMRNWARDEHSFVWSDFWDAVKANWKLALPVSVISGFLPLLVYVSWLFYGQLATDSVLYMVPMGLVLIVFTMWKLSEMVIYTMMVTYDLKLRDLLRNALLLTMAKLPLAIGVKLLTWIVPIITVLLLWFAPQIQMYVFLIVTLVYLVYIPGFNRLIIASYANALCEKYLNPNIEGAATNIGLRPENWDDTEYLPEDDED